ncbi:MAG: hypothetical protein WCO06_04135 [Candidatus Roizmanbacteria bacterium]
MRLSNIKTLFIVALFLFPIIVTHRVDAVKHNIEGTITTNSGIGIAGLDMNWRDTGCGRDSNGVWHDLIATTNTNGYYLLNASNIDGGDFGCGCGPHVITFTVPASYNRGEFSYTDQNGVTRKTRGAGTTLTMFGGSFAVSNDGGSTRMDIIFTPDDSNPPTATVSGPNKVCANTTVNYIANATDPEGGLKRLDMYKASSSSNPLVASSWSYITGVDNISSINGSTSFSAGTHYIAVNAYDATGHYCAGNSFLTFPYTNPTTGTIYQFCGANAFITINSYAPPSAVSNLTLQPNSSDQTTLDTTWIHDGTNTSSYGVVYKTGNVTKSNEYSGNTTRSSSYSIDKKYCDGKTSLSATITAYNGSNPTACNTSTPITSTTTCCILPSAVADVQTAVTYGANSANINVSWTPSESNITGYDLYSFVDGVAKLPQDVQNTSHSYTDIITDVNICNGRTPLSYTVVPKNLSNGSSCQFGNTASSLNTTCCISSVPISMLSPITFNEMDSSLQVDNRVISNGGDFYSRRLRLNWTYDNNWGNSCNNNENKYFDIIVSGPNGFNYSNTVQANNTGIISYLFDMTENTKLLSENGDYNFIIRPKNNTGVGTSATATIHKKAYDSITIDGSAGEYVENRTTSCSANVLNNSSMISITSLNTQGVRTNCSLSPSNSNLKNGYSCTITLDNVNSDPVPSQTYSLTNGSSNRYSGLYCFPTSSCISTQSNCSFAINFDPRVSGYISTITRNVSFSLSNDFGFYKLKNASYYDKDKINIEIPATISKFDDDDTDIGTTGGNTYFNIGDGVGIFNGVGLTISKDNSMNLGVNTIISRNGLKFQGYTSSVQMDVSRFLSYRMSLQTPTTMSSINNLEEGVYLVRSGTSIDGTTFPSPNKGTVLVVTDTTGGNSTGGTISLTATVINPGNKPFAIIADTINIAPNVQLINGILMANTINLGTSSLPLKINGNIINTGQTPVDTLLRSRKDDVSKPSLFIVFNPNQYMGVLKYLGVFNLSRVTNTSR